MPERTSTRAFLFVDTSSALLALLFVCAALGKLVRYLPWWGLVLVAVAELSALWLLVRHARLLLPRITPRGAAVVLVVLVALLAALSLEGHPAVERFIESHRGLGSDRDEALEVAVRALAASENPYLAELSTGNPVSPLPGELVLAAPFVWLGVSGLQTVFGYSSGFRCAPFGSAVGALS